MTKFEKKIKLYCILHGNLISNLPKKWITDNPPSLASNEMCQDSDVCIKCRAKNNGICNTRYFNYRIIYDTKTNQILEINFKRLPITYSDGYNTIHLNGKEYSEYHTTIGISCFGFLAIDE